MIEVSSGRDRERRKAAQVTDERQLAADERRLIGDGRRIMADEGIRPTKPHVK